MRQPRETKFSDFNFKEYENDFQRDTGLQIKGNEAIYINYFQLRRTNGSFQQLMLLNINILDFIQALPGDIRLELADMIRSKDFVGIFGKNISN